MDIIKEIIKIVPNLAWVGLAICVIYMLREVIPLLASAIKQRLQAGAGMKLWMLELERYDPSDLRKIEPGRFVYVEQDHEKQINNVYEQSRYVMLVHHGYKLEKKSYEVLLYLNGHWNDMSHVEYVEYYLGTGWGKIALRSDDIRRKFAVKILAAGSSLATGTIHFTDGGEALLYRYMNLDDL